MEFTYPGSPWQILVVAFDDGTGDTTYLAESDLGTHTFTSVEKKMTLK